MAIEPVPSKPVRSASDKPAMPLAATVAIGALAVFGAITLLGWVFGALFGILKVVILIVVVVAAGSWLIGRRVDR